MWINPLTVLKLKGAVWSVVLYKSLLPQNQSQTQGASPEAWKVRRVAWVTVVNKKALIRSRKSPFATPHPPKNQPFPDSSLSPKTRSNTMPVEQMCIEDLFLKIRICWELLLWSVWKGIMNYCQSVKAWLGHRQVQRNIYEYVSYIFRIQLFIVPIDVSKPNTLITTEITQWVSQQEKHQVLL